jgi:hypothetical protein
LGHLFDGRPRAVATAFDEYRITGLPRFLAGRDALLVRRYSNCPFVSNPPRHARPSEDKTVRTRAAIDRLNVVALSIRFMQGRTDLSLLVKLTAPRQLRDLRCQKRTVIRF